MSAIHCVVCDGLVGCEFCPKGWVPEADIVFKAADGRIFLVDLKTGTPTNPPLTPENHPGVVPWREEL